jgi:enamine deaminase RidA (YjgF/YER057c/UK114 family)
MRDRQNISSDTSWESIVGYSRAVRVGDRVWTAGTTATDQDGKIVGEGDPHAQTLFIIKKIEVALEKAGATLGDVVATRIYATDISQWSEIGKAHGEFFSEIRPACTMVEVSKLIDPAMLVEIEATAVIPE